VEAAVFRPQTGYYNSIEERAAALMESLANSHGFIDGNKRIAFAAATTFLEINGFVLEVDPADGHEFRFPKIVDWTRQHTKPLRQSGDD
jgi:death-on-curing protein